ncbi:MAG: BBP7 family outer membrane beta-barrel protein, partial [Planctomycetales bacterium]|nr:BBP7 family outer membrane beta-barrel protein [Planctomycetales bacterium]
TYALEGVYLSLEEESASFNASSDEFNILSRPFYNVTNDRQDARRLVFPNETTGSLQIDTDTRFQTVELLLRRNLSQRCGARIDLLLGYRFAELEERLRIDEATRVLSGVNAGTTFDLYDRFDTSNSFHGFEIGLAGTHCPDPLWTFDWRAKVALGSNNSEADIFGETTQTPNAGAAVTSEGGLLALPTNIGTFSDDSFGTITELGVTLKRRVFSRLDVSFGYSFLLWTHVARASDQIDVGINQTQLLPGGLNGDARPAVTQRTSDFWTQGLRVGLESHF